MSAQCGACLGHGVGQTLPRRIQGTCRGFWEEVLGTLGQPVGWGGHGEGQLGLAEPMWHMVGMGRGEQGGEHPFREAPDCVCPAYSGKR